MSNAIDSGKDLDTFDKFRQWKTWGKRTHKTDWENCDYHNFGLKDEPFIGKQKQCFCEPELKKTPSYCAENGKECLCNGAIYFMKKYAEDNKTPLDFFEAMQTFYTVNNANNTKTNTCQPSLFEDILPNPAVANSCWCDEALNQLDPGQIQ